MAKYLFRAKYTQAGVSRPAQGKAAAAGGRHCARPSKAWGALLHDLFYAFGDWDLFLVTELPDDETATAVSLNISAAGALEVTVTVLVTPETIDAAIRKSVPYRAPGE